MKNQFFAMLKKYLFLVVVMLAGIGLQAQQDFSLEGYFLPKNVKYSSAVPKPKAIVGHEVGEWHITHDKLVLYMKTVASARPDRIKLVTTGTTYEGREQLLLMISSPMNISNLESIRQRHLQNSDPNSNFTQNDTDPVVVWMGYSIHGNESSGSNASLIAAYYLAAAEGPQIEDMLQHTVILLDPSFNPDGLNRFATWANQHKSYHLVTDPQSREFNEVWPGGRYNHYWFDLNRDWLPAVHVESRNRLKYFHDWRPNILTDHHEMGTNSSFFFQPGVASRVNPLTPNQNQVLTAKIGAFHAKYLDSIGSMYYSREGYDDYYYGKGSTFPDIHGAVGILFEQASSRGHAQESNNGVLHFPFTIRNQFVTTLSTLEAAGKLRKQLLDFQRESYTSAIREAGGFGTEAYVFGSVNDKERSRIFAEMLARHQVKVYPLKKQLSREGATYQPGAAYAVPLRQSQYRLVRAVFDKFNTFQDSLFYDITAWTMPLAYGLDYAAIRLNDDNIDWSSPLALSDFTATSGKLVATGNSYAYLMDWHQLYAPAALFQLQQQGIITKVAAKPMTLSTADGIKHFSAGTIVIPVAMQSKKPDELQSDLQAICTKFGVDMIGTKTGSASIGADLGSNQQVTLQKVNVAMLTGTGVSPTDAGEVWHLFDQRMQIPLVQLGTDYFNRVNLDKYNVLIMVSGNYNLIDKAKLRSWISKGGVLIACEDAVQWCAQNELVSIEFNKVEAAENSGNWQYADRSEISGARRMNGAVVRASLDTTHPLGYGYSRPYIDLLKTNSVFMKPGKRLFSSPLQYGNNPLQSGYIQQDNLNALKNTASVTVQNVGGGKVILMADNPNFRAFWLGGTKLFMNAVFFGDIIN